jgi:molybdate transport system substrate-binding protein
MSWTNKALFLFAATLSVFWSSFAFAEEVHVMSSGGFTEAYGLLAPQFEAETGIVLITEYGASSGGAPDSIPMRLARGEPADLIILARYALDDLTQAGFVRGETRTDLVASKIGMAVRDGSPHPDISTEESFIATLLGAGSIAFSASASGTYLSEELFPRLGVWDQIKDKSIRVVSDRVASVVARGEAEIGFQQISELLPIEGADFVGPLPESLQLVTLFSAGITTSADNAGGAKRLLDYLSSRNVAPTIAATGLDPTADD